MATKSTLSLSLSLLSLAASVTAFPTFRNVLPSSVQQVLGLPHHGYHDITPAFPSQPGLPPAGFVAIGDSYSAGIGTGVNGSESDCRLGLHAYPHLIYDDLSNQYSNPSFQHLSCTGATINDTLAGSPESQIDKFDTITNADFALLSIGGNDLGFFDIMNSCIFRFFSFYSGTCEEALNRSREALSSSSFEERLKLLIMEIFDKVHWEKRLWFNIYVTGYARFFNAETPACDNATMGIWWRGPKLKRELRQQMNDMVLGVNKHIKESIQEINRGFDEERVFFIDYDDAFEGHRFCEEGVNEPDTSRNETWFFHVGGKDSEGGSEDDKDVDKCWGLKGKEKEKCLAGEMDMHELSGMWYVPTYYGKTFHPVSTAGFDSLLKLNLMLTIAQRSAGHKAIRDRIYELWEQHRPLS